jgi:hypothetical protein
VSIDTAIVDHDPVPDPEIGIVAHDHGAIRAVFHVDADSKIFVVAAAKQEAARIDLECCMTAPVVTGTRPVGS